MAGVEPDKGSGGSCGPAYLHGNVPTGSYARTKDENEPPFARTLATRAIARSPVHHGRECERVCIPLRVVPFFGPPCISAKARTNAGGKGRGLKTALKNVGYRRAEGSSFPLGTGSDRYFPFRRRIREPFPV